LFVSCFVFVVHACKELNSPIPLTSIYVGFTIQDGNNNMCKSSIDQMNGDNPQWSLTHFPFRVQAAQQQMKIQVFVSGKRDTCIGSSIVYVEELRRNTGQTWYTLQNIKNIHVGYVKLSTQFLPLDAQILSKEEQELMNQISNLPPIHSQPSFPVQTWNPAPNVYQSPPPQYIPTPNVQYVNIPPETHVTSIDYNNGITTVNVQANGPPIQYQPQPLPQNYFGQLSQPQNTDDQPNQIPLPTNISPTPVSSQSIPSANVSANAPANEAVPRAEGATQRNIHPDDELEARFKALND
jgi:hypothetical protein